MEPLSSLQTSLVLFRNAIKHQCTTRPDESFAVSLSHSLTLSLSHSLTVSLFHSLTLSLSHSLILSLSHSLTLSLAHSLTLLMQVVYSLVQGQPLCSHSVGTGKSGAGLVITFITADTLMCGGKVRHTRKYLV